MQLLSEEQLNLAVESALLGGGEPIIVATKGGDEMARGIVVDVYPDGSVHFRESVPDGAPAVERVYSPALYMFIPLVSERQEKEIEPDRGGIDPEFAPEPGDTGAFDLQPRSVITQMSEQDAPDDRAAEKMGKDVTQPGGKDRETDNGPKGPKSKEKKKDTDKKGDLEQDNRTPESRVDVDALPDGLKKKIIGVKGLDEESRNRVIADIADAALRSMRDVGVKDNEVFEKVVAIQKAVESVLSA